MAESVARVKILAQVEGLEGFDKLKGAFRGLQQAIGPTDQQLAKARQDIIAFGEAGKKTEQVIRGQIEALRALKTQAGTGGQLYTTLGADIRRLEGDVRGLNAAYVNLATGVSYTAKQLATLNPATRQPGLLDAQVERMQAGLERFKLLSREYIQGIADINKATQGGARNQQNNNLFSNALNANPYLQQNTFFFDATKQFEKQALAGGLPATVAAKQQEISRIKEQLQNVLRDTSSLEPLLNDIRRIENNFASPRGPAVTGGGARSTIPGLEGAGREMSSEWQKARITLGQLTTEYERLKQAQQEQVHVLNNQLIEAEDELQRMLNGTTKEQEQATRAAERRARVEEKLAQIQQDAAKAPNVGGYRDPDTGAMLARGNESTRQARANLLAQVAMPPREISSLYRSIGDVGYSRITNDIERMGNSFQEVANDIRLAKSASDGSINSLQSLRGSWAALRNTVSENSKEFREATRELQKLDRQLEKTEVGGLRGKVGYIGQGIGAIASAGIFGGPEGAIGGALGGALGATGGPAGFAAGSFIGSSIGAYAGMVRQAIGATADYSAQIDKLKIALKGITQSSLEYENALSVINRATVTFNITKDEAISAFTKLSASVIGAGGKIRDAEIVFNGVSAAIRATGGSAEDVQGALVAMAQVFSKGKATAEEIQGQLGERLPGAVTLFAEATGRTGAELAKAFEQGTVGLNDVMKFAIALGDKFQATNDKIAASSESAGDRMKVAFGSLREEIGRTFQPLGAAIQNTTADLAGLAAEALKTVRNSSELNAALDEARVTSESNKKAVEAMRQSYVGAGDGISAAIMQINAANSDRLRQEEENDRVLQNSITRFYEAEGAVNAHRKALLASGQSLDEQGKTISAAEGALTILEGRLRTLAAQNKDNTKEAEFYRAKVSELKGVLESIKSTYKTKIEIEQIFKGQGSRVNRDGKTSIPDGYRVIAGKLAYQVPGIGWVDAKTGQPLFKGATPDRGQTNFPSPDGGGSGAKDKAKSDAEKAAADQQRLAEANAQAQIRLAEQVFQAQVELDRKRFDLQQELIDKERELRIAALTGAAAEEASSAAQFFRQIDDLRRKAVEASRSATQAALKVRNAQFMQSVTGKGGGGRVIEYLTGDRSSSNYRADHGGSNYHEHLAFATAQEMRKAMEALKAAGIKIGSTTGGRHAPGSYHYSGQAFDVPASQVPVGQEQALSRKVREVLAAAGFSGQGIGAGGAQQRRNVADQADTAIAQVDLETATKYKALLEEMVQKRLPQEVQLYALEGAKAYSEQTQALKDNVAELALRQQLEASGARAEVIDSDLKKAQLTRDYTKEINELNVQLKAKEVLEDPTGMKAAGIQARIQAITQGYNDQKAAIDELTKAQIEFNDAQRFSQDMRVGEGFKAGIDEYVASLGTLKQATTDLTMTGIKGIEDALVSLVTTGKANFQEFAAAILEETARMIIQQLILKTIMQAIGLIGGGGSSLATSFEMPSAGFPTSGFSFAKGDTFANGIQPFAAGGVVSKPTLFKFANGGAMNTGLMGEAGPEAIIPLKRGKDGKLGVAGGGGTTSVVVNVDAKGSSVQGDSNQGEALGRAISSAVQAELVKQKRPGGLLAA